MIHTTLLIVHVVTGTAALVLGPLAMRQDLDRFRGDEPSTGPLSAWYRAIVLLVCVTATALVIEARADLWWLILVSGLTYGLVLLAASSARRRFPGWTHGYVHGQGGSYIALVTALIVVSFTIDGPITGAAQLIPWLAPTAIGTVLIRVWHRRLSAVLPAETTTHDDGDSPDQHRLDGFGANESAHRNAATGAATDSSRSSR